MWIKELMYGNDYIYLSFLDICLKMFEHSETIPNSRLYEGEPPPDFDKVIENLEKDGMIEVTQFGASITLKGKQKAKKGGYRREAFIKRITFVLIVIGTLASVSALIF